MTSAARYSDAVPGTSSRSPAGGGDITGSPRQAWVLVSLYFLAANGVGVLYSAAGLEVPAGLTLLTQILCILVFWGLLEAECRPYRVTFPLDMAYLLYVTSLMLLAYYLLRTQRWRGAGKLVLLVLLWGATYLLWKVTARLLALD